ncbi:MAG: hypothetical protein QM755_15230 [Luteolibacter sp.]
MNLRTDEKRQAALQGLRLTRKGMRVRHSFFGMAVAWVVLAGGGMILRWAGPAAAEPGWWRVPGLGAAFVCFISWLVIAVPAYGLWPRRSPYWHPMVVAVYGALWGCLAWAAFCMGLPLFGPVLLQTIPGYFILAALAGAICALVTRWAEEIELRRLCRVEMRNE